MPFRFGWVALTLFYLLLRFQNSPGVFTPGGVVLPDTDPYYRLVRIEKIVTGNLSYPLRDPDLHFPEGFDVPWPTGLDLLLALPLWILGIRSPEGIAAFSAVSIPLLSLPTLWGVGFVATRLAGPAAGLAAGFLLSVFRGQITSSDVGSIDHHFLEGLFTILALAFALGWKGAGTRLFGFALAGLLGLAPSFWPQAWILGPALALAFAMDWTRRKYVPTAALFFSSALVSLAPLSLSSRFTVGAISLFGFSWWTPLLYALLALLFIAVSLVRREPVPRSLGIGIALFGAALSIFLFLPRGGDTIAAPLVAGWQAITAGTGAMGITSEAVSPGRVGLLRWFRTGYHAIVLGWLWFATLAFRREAWWLAGFALIPLFLTTMQVRFFPLASPLLALGIVLFLSRLSPRPLLLATGALLIALPTIPGFRLTRIENIHPFFSPVRGASRFISEEKGRLRLSGRESAVASAWDFGHWILHDTRSPVVANPFQPLSSWETADILTSRGLEPLEAFHRKHPVRYLVVELTPDRLLRWFKMLGKNPAPYFRFRPLGEGTSPGVDPLPPFYDLLIARLFYAQGEDERGEHPPRWRLAFVSPLPSPDGSGMPALKVYERVPGARLVLRGRRGPLLLSARVRIRGGDFVFRQTALPDRNGRMEWIVPYARVNRGGVFFDGRYRVESISLTSPVISEDSVLRGETIEWRKTGF
jgi:asparagine N-glycosylation enzyme membrane subunit Stt3